VRADFDEMPPVMNGTHNKSVGDCVLKMDGKPALQVFDWPLGYTLRWLALEYQRPINFRVRKKYNRIEGRAEIQ